MKHEALIAFARSMEGKTFSVKFFGQVKSIGTKKSVSKAWRYYKEFNRGLKPPFQPIGAEGQGECISISFKPRDCEGWATIVLEKPIRLDVQVVQVRIEDVIAIINLPEITTHEQN
jgi:hypothetical protein